MFGAIGAAIGAIGGAISSAVGAIGGAIAKGIGAIATAISPMIEAVSNIVTSIAQMLGIFKEQEKPEDYGAAMRQCDKKPEDFDSTNDYINYLRDEIKNGKVDLANRSEVELAADKAMGCGLAIKGIDEKYGLKTDAEFWKVMGEKADKNKIDSKELDSMLKNAKENNINPSDISDYLNGKDISSGVPKSEIKNTIKESFKECNSDLSSDEVTKKFNDLIKKD